jgi:hypothetical protein
MRKSMQTALDGRTTMTKDGVSIQTIRARKKMTAAEVVGAKDKRFYSNGLSRTKLTGPLPAMKSLTPPQFTNPQAVIEICESTPSPPTGLQPVESPARSRPSEVGERKNKLRRRLGQSIFASNEKASNETTDDQQLHSRLLHETPSKSVDTLIGDSIAMEHDTSTTLRYLKAMARC